MAKDRQLFETLRVALVENSPRPPVESASAREPKPGESVVPLRPFGRFAHTPRRDSIFFLEAEL